jgi:hypothetical protein
MFFCFFMILARNIKYIHAKYMTKEEDICGTHWLKKPPSHGLSRAYNGHPCPIESPLIGLASLGHGRMLSEARDGSDGRRNLRAGRPARELNVLCASAMAAPVVGRPATWQYVSSAPATLATGSGGSTGGLQPPLMT